MAANNFTEATSKTLNAAVELATSKGHALVEPAHVAAKLFASGELGDRVASADGAKRLATLYVVFAQKGRANFKNETPLDAEALEAMGDARIDKEEEEDVRFLCINARQRALVFMKEYRALSEYFVWQNERLDWTQPVAKKKAF